MPSVPGEADSHSAPSANFDQPIGLVGIGLMGTVLAERMLKAGKSVCGWDRNLDQCRGLEKAGGIVAENVESLFSRCDRILLSLPSHETVAEVLKVVQSNLRGGQLIIDMSTGDPDAAVAQSDALAARGIHYVDATVSGSSEQLRQGKAVILVGATDQSYQKCRDLLQIQAEKIFHTGLPGSGARMKLVTNLVLGLNRAALAEGLCFANVLGLDPDQTLHLLKESMSYSRIMDTKGEKMIRRDFTTQARLSQHLKDVRLIQSAAGPNSRLPLTEVHRSLLEEAERMGLGDQDNSAILDAIAVGCTNRPRS